MENIEKGLSRRTFLAFGGVAALGGAAALAGCAPQSASSADKAAADSDANEAATMKTADETRECDIVVEKGGNVGVGNGALAGGPFMVGSKLQHEAGVDFTVE